MKKKGHAGHGEEGPCRPWRTRAAPASGKKQCSMGDLRVTVTCVGGAGEEAAQQGRPPRKASVRRGHRGHWGRSTEACQGDVRGQMPHHTKGSGSVLEMRRSRYSQYRLVLGSNTNSEFLAIQTAELTATQYQFQFLRPNIYIQTRHYNWDVF
jgi:hypothetical protein